MPRPSKRTHSRKHRAMALPGGNRTLAYRKRPPTRPRCSSCGRPLTGFSRLSVVKQKKVSRTGKRIWRIRGGQMCHDCIKKQLKLTARSH